MDVIPRKVSEPAADGYSSQRSVNGVSQDQVILTHAAGTTK